MLGWVFNFLRTLVTLLILGGLSIWLAPALLNHAAGQVENKPLPSAGYGFVDRHCRLRGCLCELAWPSWSSAS